MKCPDWITRCGLAIIGVALSGAAYAQQAMDGGTTVRTSGISGIWVLANVSFAGMRAQGSRNTFWRLMAFLFGLPGTLLTLLVVPYGGERAYGVDIPKKREE